MNEPLRAGAVRLRNVSRSFRVVHEHNRTLKEAVLRRRRTSATEHWALRHVDLDIAPGQSVGVIGQNGSGKSTLLKLVAGILRPQTGSVDSAGKVASMLELGAGFHPDFTGRENVFMNGAIHGLAEREIATRFDDIVEFSELADFIDMPVKTYSSGMYMRLAFSVAVHVDADILLLDEVLAVGDEAFQRKCFGRISRFRREGGTLLFVSHDAGTIEVMCDRAIYLADGAVAVDGPPREALARYHEDLAGLSHPLDRGGSTGAGTASYGTGQIRITDVRLLNKDDEPSRRFLGGEPMSIQLDYEFVDPETPEPKFCVRVSDATGQVLFGVNTLVDDVSWYCPRPDGSVTLTIRQLPIFQGQCVLTVSVCAPDDSELYHLLDNLTEFTVFGPRLGEGVVFVDRRWSITAEHEERLEAGRPS